MSAFKRSRMMLALATAGTLALTACGGSDSTGSTGSSGGSAASARSSSSSQTSTVRAKAITVPWILSRPSGPSVSMPAAASM